MHELQQMVGDFLADRPVMAANNSDPEKVFNLLEGEVAEARAEINDPEKMATELADILFFTLTIANHYGIDVAGAMKEKTARNHLKYPPKLFSNGRTYDQARAVALEQWKAQNGEKWFYEEIAPALRSNSPTVTGV